MIRNLKILGLALGAVFAFSAMTAAGASAQTRGDFTSSVANTTLLGTETGAVLDNSFTAFGGSTRCPGSTITGGEKDSTVIGQPGIHQNGVPNKATEITLTPHFTGCITKDEGGSEFSTTVDMNGCDFLLTIGETTPANAPDTYGVDIHVVCPAGKNIQITLFSSGTHNLRLCTLTVTTTTPVSDAHLTNTKGPDGVFNTNDDDIDLEGTFTSIEVHKSGLCSAGATDKTAVQHIDGTVKGFEGAAQKGIRITH